MKKLKGSVLMKKLIIGCTTVLVVGLLSFGGYYFAKQTLAEQGDAVYKFAKNVYEIEYVEGKTKEEYLNELATKVSSIVSNQNEINLETYVDQVIENKSSIQLFKEDVKYSDIKINRMLLASPQAEFRMVMRATNNETGQEHYSIQPIDLELTKINGDWKINNLTTLALHDVFGENNHGGSEITTATEEVVANTNELEKVTSILSN